MAIPDYQSVMLPMLHHIKDGREYPIRDVIEAMVKQHSLTDIEQNELLPTGQRIIDNRVGWARTYLKKAGLVESPRRGVVKITPRGASTLKEKVSRIDIAYLKQFPEFLEFQSRRNTEVIHAEEESSAQQTPEESLEYGYGKISENLTQELAKSIKGCSPSFFEKLVVDLLLKMGYGGSIKDAGKAIGQTGDGGIDGIIKEDKLGLDAIYIQAKRWENSVGRPEIHKFVGALEGQRAKKGVFITTSYFTKEALDYVARIGSKVVLIDGEALAQLMIENNVGVSTIRTYEVKKIDSDYFIEE